MIINIYIVLIAATLAMTKIKYRTFIKPNTIFSTIWCIAGILAICNNLGLIKPSLQIHMYIIVSVITFNLIYFISLKNIQKVNVESDTLKLQINYKLITAFSIIGLLLISPNTFKAIRILLLNNFSLSAVRYNYASMTASGRYFYVLATNNIPIAIFGATSMIAAIDLVNKRWNLLLLSIFSIFIGTITFGGRYLILNFIVYYISGYTILKKYKKIRIRKSYIVIAVIMLVCITVSRGTSGLSILDMGVLYYVGSLSFLGVITAYPAAYGLTGGLMYGYLTFGFLFEPIVLVLKQFLGFTIKVPSYYFNVYVQPFVNIGDTTIRYYNNNTTMLYTFIRDFGELGVVIGTALIALAACITENRFEKYSNIRNLYFLVLIYSVIFNSLMIYTMTSISSSLLIIFILIFTGKKRTKLELK